jgi:hypothetical protein
VRLCKIMEKLPKSFQSSSVLTMHHKPRCWDLGGRMISKEEPQLPSDASNWRLCSSYVTIMLPGFPRYVYWSLPKLHMGNQGAWWCVLYPVGCGSKAFQIRGADKYLNIVHLPVKVQRSGPPCKWA